MHIKPTNYHIAHASSKLSSSSIHTMKRSSIKFTGTLLVSMLSVACTQSEINEQVTSIQTEAKSDITTVKSQTTHETTQVTTQYTTVTAKDLPKVTAVAKTVQYDGVVEAVKEAKISAQVAGTLTNFRISAGDKVQAGQVLARIDNRSANAQVVASQAQIAGAHAQLDAAKAELDRQQMLYNENYVSKAALERAQANYKATSAQVKGLIAQNQVAQTNQDYFTIRAPFTGVVSQVHAVQGDMAMMGQPLLTLFKDDQLRVAISLPQNVANQINLSTPNSLNVTVPALNQKLSIANAKFLPVADIRSQSRTLRLRLAKIPNGLTTGMMVKATLPVIHHNANNTATTLASQKSNASSQSVNKATIQVFVPNTVIARRGELVGIYILDDNGKPQLRQVKLGTTQGNRVEVLSGLSNNDKILTSVQQATNQSKPNSTETDKAH